MLRVTFASLCACVLAGCSTGVNASSPPKADIGKVTELKSSFGPEFTVKETRKRAADPTFFSTHRLPPGLSFDPPECAKVAMGPEMPPGLGGSTATVSAEGNGNAFVVIGMETTKPLPFDDPGQHCSNVSFSGGRVQGSIKTVDAPKIDGARTIGVHRVLQAVGAPNSSEMYRYTAQFGNYEVVVVASPLSVPDQPVVLVDTQRAQDLLVKAITAIRS